MLRGRRPAADRGAQGHPGRGRPGHRHRPGLGPRVRQDAQGDDRPQGRPSCSRTTPARPSGSRSSAPSDDRWMVAVRMVSEGVDVPRLAVGVYATTISTPLFFAQAVGRFVRSRRRGETASVFVPTIPMLLEFAERDGGRARPRARQAEEGGRGGPVRGGGQAPRGRGEGRGRGDRGRHAAVRGAGVRRGLRPGALRRRRVRHAGAPGQRGGAGLPRHPRAAGTRPGADTAPAPAGPADRPQPEEAGRGGRSARTARRAAARWSPTANCWSCASS